MAPPAWDIPLDPWVNGDADPEPNEPEFEPYPPIIVDDLRAPSRSFLRAHGHPTADGYTLSGSEYPIY